MTEETTVADPLGVKVFTSFAEIEAVAGYLPDNPVDAQNYRQIIAEYSLDDKIACCVRKPSGKLCSEPHGFGFMARLDDGSATVIGNNCASTKFGANSQFSRDRKAHNQRKARAKTLGRLSDILREWGTVDAGLEASRGFLKALEAQIGALRDDLGTAAFGVLTSMARDGRSAIVVSGVSVRRYVDEDGKPREERQRIPFRIGTLSGIDLFRANSIAAAYEQIRQVRAAFAEAQALAESKKRVSPLTIEKLVAILGDDQRVGREVGRLNDAYRAFLKNDYSHLCYLVSDRGTRYRLAQLALRLQGLPDRKDSAKEFIAALDAKHKAAFNVEKLQF